MDTLSSDDKKVKYYTGLSSFDTLLSYLPDECSQYFAALQTHSHAKSIPESIL